MTDEDRRKLFGKWWWTNIGNRDSAAARARAARLRRAEAVEVLVDRSVHDLAQDLGLGAKDAKPLIRTIQALAEVRDSGPRMARCLGKGDPPALSPLRFERLIRSTGDEIGISVRRSLPMVGRACDPGYLGLDLLRWNENTRIRWTFEYFAKRPPEDTKHDPTDTPAEAEA